MWRWSQRCRGWSGPPGSPASSPSWPFARGQLRRGGDDEDRVHDARVGTAEMGSLRGCGGPCGPSPWGLGSLSELRVARDEVVASALSAAGATGVGGGSACGGSGRGAAGGERGGAAGPRRAHGGCRLADSGAGGRCGPAEVRAICSPNPDTALPTFMSPSLPAISAAICSVPGTPRPPAALGPRMRRVRAAWLIHDACRTHCTVQVRRCTPLSVRWPLPPCKPWCKRQACPRCERRGDASDAGTVRVRCGGPSRCPSAAIAAAGRQDAAMGRGKAQRGGWRGGPRVPYDWRGGVCGVPPMGVSSRARGKPL
jgi:hypothetical protein